MEIPTIKESLSVVMPVYNEAEIIQTVIDDYGKILQLFENPELVVVNDNSTDNTLSVLTSLASRHPYLRIITLDRNRGHGPALMRAFREARNDYIFHSDSDNQFDSQDFWILWKKLKAENLDVVIGYRKQRNDSVARLLLTRLLRMFLFLTFGVRLPDSNSPFRLYTRSALNRLLPLLPEHPLIPSILMATAAVKMSLKMGWQSVQHLPRKTGKSFFRSWKIFKLCFPAIQEVLRFRSQLA